MADVLSHCSFALQEVDGQGGGKLSVSYCMMGNRSSILSGQFISSEFECSTRRNADVTSGEGKGPSLWIFEVTFGEDVGIFISRVKTAATRLQVAGHKLDDLYIGFQLIRWLPQEFQSTVQQIYRWKEEDFRVVKIEAELILEANRLQLMKQDLEKAENAYLSSFTSKKSKTLSGATAAAHGDSNGKNDYQKKVPDHYIISKSKEISLFSDVTAKTRNGSIEIWHQRFCHVNNDYLVKTSKNDSVKGLPRLNDNGKTPCIPCKLAKSKSFIQKDGGRKIKTSIGIVAYGPLWSNAN
ncbi:retrovirus-related Pol polyprotein from transposon TNT 1-94 [Trichonephila clavipes]|nr:retrovirus-related Pol polyprotein from transposon TNT 1-94 [Trichonephila clavipes]